jgi:hypothetical protein
VSRRVVARDWGQAGIGSYGLINTEFQLGKMKTFWGHAETLIAQSCDRINVPRWI